jgi:hypothetical protein
MAKLIKILHRKTGINEPNEGERKKSSTHEKKIGFAKKIKADIINGLSERMELITEKTKLVKACFRDCCKGILVLYLLWL